MTAPDLFNYSARYPHVPGAREHGGTSEAAAEQIAPTVASLRQRVLASLREVGPATADEAAARIGADILAVRPRFSELYRLGAIRKTQARRPNRSGAMAVVWSVVGEATP